MISTTSPFVRRAYLLLLLMGVFAVIYNLYLPAHPDEAYYWEWSRHLALSYYDGPPLMAYLIRVVTAIFGISASSIKLTAVLCMTVGLYFIFLLTRELFDEKTAFCALVLLMFLPIIQAGYVISSLDPGMFCFWSLTLYWFYLAVSRDNNFYRYLAGFALGLTTLTKYPGLLLGISLFLFMLLTPYRKQLKNINWYLAAILSILVFSPVLIWNWQHDWISFSFQYHHGVAQHKVFNLDSMINYLSAQIGIANPIFLISAIYFSLRYLKLIFSQPKILYVAIPFWLVFLFFFYNSLFKHANQDWAAPAYISAAVFMAYFVQQYQRKILLYAIVILSLVLMIFIRFPITTPFLPKDAIILKQFLGYQELIQQAIPYYKKTEIVVSNDRHSAAELALYLPGHPNIYILSNTKHQYAYWSKPIKKAIITGKIKSVLYIGSPSNVNDLKHYFRYQRLLQHLNYNGRWNTRHWVVVDAWNN